MYFVFQNLFKSIIWCSTKKNTDLDQFSVFIYFNESEAYGVVFYIFHAKPRLEGCSYQLKTNGNIWWPLNIELMEDQLL